MSVKLEDTRVFRGGRTAREMKLETESVELDGWNEDGALRLRFRMKSKGGGITRVTIKVGPKDFAKLLDAMIRANRQDMMREAAAVLAVELGKQKDREKAIAMEARQSVVDAANQAYQDAPEGRDHVEGLVRG